MDRIEMLGIVPGGMLGPGVYSALKKGVSGAVGKAIRAALLTTSLGLVVGCAGQLIDSGGFHVSKKWFEDDVRQIKPRAAFEMGCPQEQIELVVLAVANGQSAQPISIGATGCGKKLVYVEIRGPEWVLNSDSRASQN